MQVLIIEDDAPVRHSYVKILEQAGFEVTSASNGVDAFRVLPKGTFQAVVCDVALPGLEGTTFFELLSQRYPDLAERVLFVTGYGRDDNTRRLLEHTGRPFLTKPVELPHLVAAVTKVARQSNGH